MPKTILQSLPAEEILQELKGKTYEEVARHYNTSRGSIWRIVAKHNAFKYKDLHLDNT